MSTLTAQPAQSARVRSVIVSAWAVPALTVGQFAMLAVVPVVVLTVTVFRDARLRALRWWTAAVAGSYATGLAAWAIGPDRAPSLSKDLNPALATLISLAGAAVAVRYHRLQRD
ncbi:hypothetical protein SRB5_00190 [Streptomyces sp. RB5]|uniref:Uncharacterized protein n=1 Tax=Streptomyces smaragdinus TaxID=2585196 RepID=A0A7K0C946_9ACTN|nr:hypothetical protein [Streptomyces smaragdinus]MQY09916.1 hypothetical protein [Streptomyces smaragdinus]